MDDNVIVNIALKAVEMLASCGGHGHAPSPAAAAAAEGNLGAGISGGELPHVQASVLYVLRVGVIEQMSENGQARSSDSGGVWHVCLFSSPSASVHDVLHIHLFYVKL